ncbi:MAG: DUF2892 domain-containing protein [FCB group bacterium]|nr:DUF2892 domain-containing protein [FCB group bacterium]
MIKNVGSSDKLIRYLLGLVILGFGYYYKSWWGLVGIIPIGTALMGWCPAYLPFKLSTNKKED